MIKIHEKLWYVINPSRAEEEDNLAYMTHWEDNEAFRKRKVTGIDWASRKKWNYTTKQYEGPDAGEGVIIDNIPVSGIYIGSSVCRWSTSNKLFRVSDPRGFTVEVPTDNIATLLHLTTVKNGIVQEECVWARDGSNHIILPVNSEPYLETLGKMDVLKNKLISVPELKSGDHVKLFEDDKEYIFLGRGKVTWEISPCNKIWEGYSKWRSVYGKPYEHTSSGYFNIFKCKYGSESYYTYRTITSPKIVEVIKNEVLDLSQENIVIWPSIKMGNEGQYNYNEYDHKVKEVKWK